MRSQFLRAASVVFYLVGVRGLDLESAPFEAAGIQNSEGFGAPYAENDDLAILAPASEWGKKNESVPVLQDRSLELVGRQTCSPGYGYCPGFGKCCPETAKCCSWGYCINPENTCCPNKPCAAGWNCCGATHCSPVGAQCCYDGSYCSAGNICVIIVRTGQLVCCTDLSCTAHVVSGTTSFLRPTNPPASITQPPPVTTRGVDIYTTYYWTVTWWYYSYYWVTFQVVQSTVTYTQIYRTTTYTTTATDDRLARSFFSSLSKTLHFDPPPDAHTDLASLLNVLPSETGSVGFGDDSTAPPLPTDTSSSSTTLDLPPLSLPSDLASLLPSFPFPTTTGGRTGAASGVFIQWALVGLGALSGVLMIWL